MKYLLYFLFTGILSSVSGQHTFEYKNFTKQMCSPDFHGRGYVEGGDSLAADYIARTFEQIGIQKLSDQYFQTFSFSVNTFPKNCSFEIKGTTLIPGKEFITSAMSGGTCEDQPCQAKTFKTKFISGSDFLRYAVANQIQKIPLEKNHILVVENIGYSLDSSRKIAYFIGQYAQREPIIETVDEKFTWSVSQVALKKLYVKVQSSKLNRKNEGQKVRINIQNQFMEQHKARNVLGLIPARKKSKGTVLLTAHYDHLGRFGSETYFPGANDNASGVAMILELAQKIKQRPLKRLDVIFVGFAGEEIGLLGSKYLSEHPMFDLKNIRFQLNLDIMGSGEKGITAVNGRILDKQFRKLQKLNKRLKSVPIVKSRGKAANSDHHYFTEKGVPGFFIYTMGNNQNYHDVFDTYDALSFASFDALSFLFDAFLRKL